MKSGKFRSMETELDCLYGKSVPCGNTGKNSVALEKVDNGWSECFLVPRVGF